MLSAAFLFVTDLDNTYVGNDAALAELMSQLSNSRREKGTKIVYATGRSLYLYRLLARNKSLLEPDALIASVGTEIYFDLKSDRFDREWAQVLAAGWNRSEIEAIAAQYSQLQPQPESEQGEFKVSYYLAGEAATKEVLPSLEKALSDRGFDVQLIYSAGQDLDILPRGGNKGLAVQFLQRHWGMEDVRTVVCGDSGNDIALFEVGEARGIIVGNAQSELRAWYEANRTDFRYFATEEYAAGILEGLQHFGWVSIG